MASSLESKLSLEVGKRGIAHLKRESYAVSRSSAPDIVPERRSVSVSLAGPRLKNMKVGSPDDVAAAAQIAGAGVVGQFEFSVML
jgi:hypothetical protein